MNWQQLIADVFERIEQVLKKALDGLTLDDLGSQPHPDSNSIGWLVWHLTRAQDRAISSIAGEEQLWIKDGWYSRFNRAADPNESGFGHSSADVAAFKSPDVKTLLAYHHAVLERTKQHVSKLTTEELGRELGDARFPTVEARLVAIISDNLQHTGQVAYLRGLLKGKGWLET